MNWTIACTWIEMTRLQRSSVGEMWQGQKVILLGTYYIYYVCIPSAKCSQICMKTVEEVDYRKKLPVYWKCICLQKKVTCLLQMAMRKKNNLWTDLTEAQIQGLPHLSQLHTKDTLFNPRFIPAIPPYCNPICTTRNLTKKKPR